MRKTTGVLIGILTWNKKDKLFACLDSIKKLNFKNYQVLVVDNGSSDGTSSLIKKKSPEITLITLKKNLGAAGGRNVIIGYFLERGDWDYLFFLDDDAVVERDTLREMVRIAEEKNAGVVGAKVLYYNRPEIIWCAGGAYIDWKRGRFHGSKQGDIDKREDISCEVDTVPIGFSLVSREAIEKAGNIDEKFFIYYEESDWHVRVKRAGFKIFYAPRAKICHKVSSSLGLESPSFYYYRTRNRLLFMRKNAKRKDFFLFMPYFLWDFNYNTLLTLLMNRMRPQFKAAMLGFIDFFRGKFGERKLKEDFLDASIFLFLGKKFKNLIQAKAIDIKRKLKYHGKKLLKKPLIILINSSWRLGDEIACLPVYERIKEKYPGAEIDVLSNYPEILLGYDFLHPVKKPDVSKYDLILDLKGENPVFSRRENLERKLKIKINRYPEIKVERKPGENIIGISVGAGWECKKWPRKYFEEFAVIMEREGFEVWFFGLPDEKVKAGKDFTGNSLGKCIENLKKCSIFVGNDSGLLHLSLALQIPSLGLFGPTDPEKLYMNNPLLYPIKSPVFCQGCWNRGEMLHPDVCPQGIPECMRKIEVSKMLKAVERFLFLDKGRGREK
ncbi:MAG: glycosyltransferase [Caldiserica bacterium]|nr:glycosyltransferase [Caldisericota bacterium]